MSCGHISFVILSSLSLTLQKRRRARYRERQGDHPFLCSSCLFIKVTRLMQTLFLHCYRWKHTKASDLATSSWQKLYPSPSLKWKPKNFFKRERRKLFISYENYAALHQGCYHDLWECVGISRKRCEVYSAYSDRCTCSLLVFTESEFKEQWSL